MDYTFNTSEMFTRIVKYLMEGLVIGIVASILPSKSLSTQEIILLALTAASVFAILDLVAPATGSASRFGVGIVSGASLLGGF
jgi:ABC-type Co2+ transport system permease subunit